MWISERIRLWLCAWRSSFNFRQSLAALGSIIWAFSSYFFIIIAAGHIWKVWALAYLPPMIAGVVLAYRGKYLKGLLLTAIFSAFEVQANHVQMTYYYLFIILFMVIAFLVDAIKKGELARFGKATAVCVVGSAKIRCSNSRHRTSFSGFAPYERATRCDGTFTGRTSEMTRFLPRT